MRPRSRRGVRAAVLAGVLLGGCAELLAPPAAGGARLSIALHPGAPAAQTAPDSAFDAVDGVSVRVYDGEQTVLVADSFAVVPDSGVIRQTLLVPLDDGGTVWIEVWLTDDGKTVFTGEQTVRLARGELNTVEVPLRPYVPPDPGAAAVVPAQPALPGGADLLREPGTRP